MPPTLDQLDPNSRRALILALQRAIKDQFSVGDWKELGYLSGTEDWVSGHSQLLRSLTWGDDDYAGHVFTAIERMLEQDPENLGIMLRHEKVMEWMRVNEPSIYSEFASETASVPPFRPSSLVTSDVVERAITDAETLIHSNGAISAVDRVHTALHGYLIAVCDQQRIACGTDPSLTDLLKAIRQHHPAFQNLGPRSGEVEKILRSFGAVGN